MVVDQGGAARTVVDQVPGGPPIGLGWLPDERLLVVASAASSLLTLEPDGGLAPYADLSGATAYPCNELVVDGSGRAYVNSTDAAGMPRPAPSEQMVVHPDGRVEGGQVRDRVETDQGAFACTLGGDDGRTLFVTTSVNPFMGAASGRPGRIVAFQVQVPGTGSP
jgi:sugar lactone lactonase YvrE